MTIGSPVAIDGTEHHKVNIQDEPATPDHSGQFTSEDDRDDGNCILIAPSAASSRDKAAAFTCGWRSADVLTGYIPVIIYLFACKC
jgi:hypothetical protein